MRRFQDARTGRALCVGSLEAASHGFTLTAAANVAFLELAWTPAKHDQAEDRAAPDRAGARVTAWYLLAAETIDERIAKLLEEKRRGRGLADGWRKRDERGVGGCADWVLCGGRWVKGASA